MKENKDAIISKRKWCWKMVKLSFKSFITQPFSIQSYNPDMFWELLILYFNMLIGELCMKANWWTAHHYWIGEVEFSAVLNDLIRM